MVSTRDATGAVSVTTPIRVDPDGVDSESVVIAAVLISSDGDLEQAIADGWINWVDAEAAKAGLADGSLAALFDGDDVAG